MILNLIPIKVYFNMDNLKIIVFMLNKALHFKFIYNLQKLQLQYSK
jgi:hypothetical protein